MRLHQRVGRINRYGQKKAVEVFSLRNQETVESLIWQHLEDKLDPDRSTAESVDEMAQQKQIAKAAQSTQADVSFPARAHAATMTFVPVSPLGRDQRATAVGEAGQHEQNTAAADTADDGERAALKRMALARDNYRIGKIPAMGSLSPLLSRA